MLCSTVYIHRRKKLLETDRRSRKREESVRKHMDAYGSLWKTRDQSIDKLRKQWAKRPGVTDEDGTEGYGIGR